MRSFRCIKIAAPQYLYSMKRDLFLDSCTVVGATVGVGFLSGKEAQTFFGEHKNVAFFAIYFFVFNLAIRQFCYKNGCGNAASFSRACFGKFSAMFLAALCLCNFVCAVSILAGLQSCLEQLFFATKLPVFAFVAALVAAFVLKTGLKTFKILNVISIVLALAYLFCVALFTPHIGRQTSVSWAKPLVYSLFSVTASLGVLAPLSQKGKQNVASTIFATVLLCALMCIVIFAADFSLSLPVFGKTDSVALNVFGAVTVVLATITGVVANALPIVQCVNLAFRDSALSTTCVLCLAVAISMFGFDFALRYGYVPVAFVGAISVVAAAYKLAKNMAFKNSVGKFRKHTQTKVSISKTKNNECWKFKNRQRQTKKSRFKMKA